MTQGLEHTLKRKLRVRSRVQQQSTLTLHRETPYSAEFVGSEEPCKTLEFRLSVGRRDCVQGSGTSLMRTRTYSDGHR
jgi:hypothetical protein